MTRKPPLRTTSKNLGNSDTTKSVSLQQSQTKILAWSIIWCSSSILEYFILLIQPKNPMNWKDCSLVIQKDHFWGLEPKEMSCLTKFLFGIHIVLGQYSSLFGWTKWTNHGYNSIDNNRRIIKLSATLDHQTPKHHWEDLLVLDTLTMCPRLVT